MSKIKGLSTTIPHPNEEKGDQVDKFYVQARVIEGSPTQGYEIDQSGWNIKLKWAKHLGMTFLGSDSSQQVAIIPIKEGTEKRIYLEVTAPENVPNTDYTVIFTVAWADNNGQPIQYQNAMWEEYAQFNLMTGAFEQEKGDIKKMAKTIKELRKLHTFSNDTEEYNYVNNVLNHHERLKFDKVLEIQKEIKDIYDKVLNEDAKQFIAQDAQIVYQMIAQLAPFAGKKGDALKKIWGYKYYFAQLYTGHERPDVANLPFIFRPSDKNLDPLTFKEFKNKKSPQYAQFMQVFIRDIYKPMQTLLDKSQSILDKTMQLKSQMQKKAA